MNYQLRSTILFLTLFLSGCMTVASTTASMTYDRYNLQNNIANHAIAMMIEQKIQDNPAFAGSKITATCFNYEVLLTGTTISAKLRNKAAKIAANTAKVKHVYNFIEIGMPSITTEELYDDWLTATVKGQIIAQAKMDPDKIKVVTENNTVYLMGYLTKKQADIAVKTARYTNGVKHVVKIFKYVIYSTKA